jgi:4'-phosphopantetheinyl transferase
MQPKLHEVYWLEQAQSDTPIEDDWLSASELVRLHSMRFPKRRADWRLGRWTAKRALSLYLHMAADPSTLAHIEVRTLSSGAPQVFIADEPAFLTISLSHRCGVAICTVARSQTALGCDLEIIEPRSDSFVADYFAAEEQALVRQVPAPDRKRIITLLWSAKETALKALQTGLRLSTQAVIVELPDGFECAKPELWSPLRVRHANALFHGWWSHRADLVRTIAASPEPGEPILLVPNEANVSSVSRYSVAVRSH